MNFNSRKLRCDKMTDIKTSKKSIYHFRDEDIIGYDKLLQQNLSIPGKPYLMAHIIWTIWLLKPWETCSGETLPSPKIEKKDREIRLERQKLDELNCTGTVSRLVRSLDRSVR